MKRMAILFGAAAIAMASPSFAASGAGVGGGGGMITQQAAMLQSSDWVWSSADSEDGPLNIIVSLTDQRAYVFRGNAMVAVSSVSTGRDGKETPIGVYPILQKQVTHKSTLYDSAPMPYMERLTWDGVALHAGVTPGYRSSHGCVHLPKAFAEKLYGETKVGTVVEVTDASVVQTDPRMLPPDPAVDEENTADANTAVLASTDQTISLPRD